MFLKRISEDCVAFFHLINRIAIRINSGFLIEDLSYWVIVNLMKFDGNWLHLLKLQRQFRWRRWWIRTRSSALTQRRTCWSDKDRSAACRSSTNLRRSSARCLCASATCRPPSSGSRTRSATRRRPINPTSSSPHPVLPHFRFYLFFHKKKKEKKEKKRKEKCVQSQNLSLDGTTDGFIGLFDLSSAFKVEICVGNRR